MALINTQIKPFAASAFKDGAFITVSADDIKDKWAVFYFYPADFTFVCPTELATSPITTRNCSVSASRSSRCPPTPTSRTRRGTDRPTPSARSSTHDR